MNYVAESDNLREVDNLDAVALIASLSDERARLRAELSVARAEIAELRAELGRRPPSDQGPVTIDRLPVLCRDLARWSAPRVAARPVGPPPPPPSLDDLEAVTRHVEALRRLLRLPTEAGKPYHAGFDATRYHTLQVRIREAAALGEKLLGQVERSRNQKDVQWHMMVMRRSEEVNRSRR